MAIQRPSYSERTWAPLWFWMLAWGAGLAAALGVGYSGFADAVAAGQSAWIAAMRGTPWLLFPMAVTAVFGRLDVELRSSHLLVAFGPLRLCRKRVPYRDVSEVSPETYRPILDFGGWGIRFRGQKTAWTIRGNRAARIRLRSGRELWVGSRFPQRLADRIRVAVGRKQAAKPKADEKQARSTDGLDALVEAGFLEPLSDD